MAVPLEYVERATPVASTLHTTADARSARPACRPAGRPMTFEDELEVRRASVGAKVLGFAFAILAVLGSFWTVVWFIRSYVEQPRVTLAPTVTVATAGDRPAGTYGGASSHWGGRRATRCSRPSLRSCPGYRPGPRPCAAARADHGRYAAAPAASREARDADAEGDSRSSKRRSALYQWFAFGSLGGDRTWQRKRACRFGSRGCTTNGRVNPAPPPALRRRPLRPMAAPPQAAPGPAATESQIEEVEETSVPAIAGPAPLPRRKPTHVGGGPAHQPPLPRARPGWPRAAEHLDAGDADRRSLSGDAVSMIPKSGYRFSGRIMLQRELHSSAAPASIR